MSSVYLESLLVFLFYAEFHEGVSAAHRRVLLFSQPVSDESLSYSIFMLNLIVFAVIPIIS